MYSGMISTQTHVHCRKVKASMYISARFTFSHLQILCLCICGYYATPLKIKLSISRKRVQSEPIAYMNDTASCSQLAGHSVKACHIMNDKNLVEARSYVLSEQQSHFRAIYVCCSEVALLFMNDKLCDFKQQTCMQCQTTEENVGSCANILQ